MNSNELTTSPNIPLQQRELIRRAIRMEICLYLWLFICYTIIFYTIAFIIILKKIMGIGSLLCIYITTTVVVGSIIYLKAKKK